MRLSCIVILAIFIIAIPASLSWSPLPNTLVGCSSTAGTYFTGSFYQICGYLGAPFMDYQYIQIFNGATWIQSSSSHPGGGVHLHSAAVWNGKLVISGGQSQSSFYNFTSIYDPSGSSWIQSTPMPISNLCSTAMASVNNKCYMFGGLQGNSYYNTTYQWTPGDSAMVPKASMPGARRGLAVAECNGLIYAFGGSSDPTTETNTIWVYNPINNSWVTKQATLIYPVRSATAVTIGNYIFILGGFGGQQPQSSVEVYDTISDQISLSTPLPIASGGHASAGYITENSNTSYTGHIFVSGGSLGTGAYIGTVSGVYCNKVEPTTLGNLKALYHQ